MSLRLIIFGIVALGFIGASIGLSFFGEYAIGRYKFWPFTLVQKVEKKLLGDFLAAKAGEEEKQFDSIFLRLDSERSIVPVERDGAGGGLTSFGDAVLLLTHEGKIFSARSARDIKEMAIETPENGLSAYRRAAESERYRNFTHNFNWFRYNDILYYRSGSEHGLVLSYTEFDEDTECYVTAIAILVLNPDIRSVEEMSARREDWEVVYRTQPCLPLKEQWRAIEGHMAGGRITFEAPATVYLASGDYAWDGIYAPEAIAQDPDKHYGKVIAIDLTSRQARIFSTGHRNMQGIVIDRNDQLWVVEHGMRGGDELNRVIEGANYGWPEETLGTMYNRLPVPNTRSYGRHEDFTAPTFAWLPSVATSNLTLIEGFHESWDGDLLVASLRGQSLIRLRVKDDRVVFAERIRIGKRIRYVHQHSDGRLVLWTDDKYLIFLTAAEQSFVAEFIQDYIDNAGYDDTQQNQIEVALGSCIECHSLEPGVHTDAPSLAAIFEAPIGATSYGGYSETLEGRGGRWSRAELAAFLQDPGSYAPGTTMPDPGIDDPSVLEELINLLEAVSNTAE